MPHIHTEPGHHDLTASAYIFRTDGVKPRVLLHMHRSLNKYLQFGGHVELHEHPWATVIHEIREESGYDMSQLTLLQPPHARLTKLDDGGRTAVHPLPFSFMTFPHGDQNHFHTDAAYVFTANQDPLHQIAAGESTMFKQLRRSEVTQLSAPNEIPVNVQSNILHAFDHILGQWDSVDSRQYRL